MNKMEYLDSIYSDFFGDNIVQMKTSNSNESKEDDTSLLSKIDALYITDESKELLKKIINYMNRYKDNNTDIYIPIRLIINSNSDKTIKDVIEILSLCIKLSLNDEKSRIVIDCSRYNAITITDLQLLILKKRQPLEETLVYCRKKSLLFLQECC